VGVSVGTSVGIIVPVAAGVAGSVCTAVGASVSINTGAVGCGFRLLLPVSIISIAANVIAIIESAAITAYTGLIPFFLPVLFCAMKAFLRAVQVN